jgi:hypothetical protein
MLEDVYEQDFFDVCESEVSEVFSDVGFFRVRVHVRPAV